MIIQFKQINRSLDTETILPRLNAGADDIVYIGGSLVDGSVNPLSGGMGNESSDVDVFIIKGGADFRDSESEYKESIKKTFLLIRRISRSMLLSTTGTRSISSWVRSKTQIYRRIAG